ncbi:MAG: hypothetical protein IPQ22_15160 [Rhodoferax sp.]|nr:hypothetical protein [Rhodoferax sp.]
MISGLTSSEFNERLAYGALIDGRWRKHIKGLRERLARAHELTAAGLLKIGFELFCEPKAGVFLWARHPNVPNATRLACEGRQARHFAGPGALFTLDSSLAPSPVDALQRGVW